MGFFHGEGDAFSGDVDFEDGDFDALLDFDDFVGVLDEAVGELADVDQAVLVDADVDEGAEGGDVGDDAGELHAGLEIFDLVDAFGELKASNCWRGSRPGLASSVRMSVRVGRPTLSVT